MSLFTDTITIYNSIGEGEWKSTVIKGAQWTNQEITINSEKNAKIKKMVKNITVDFGRNYGNEQYVDPIAFKKLKDKRGFWTLDPESGLDVVVLGETNRVLSEEYRPKHLRNDMECATITSVSDYRNRNFLKHIKVVAE